MSCCDRLYKIMYNGVVYDSIETLESEVDLSLEPQPVIITNVEQLVLEV